MKACLKWIVVLVLVALEATAGAAVTGVRTSSGTTRLRIVLDLDAPAAYKVNYAANTLTVDLETAAKTGAPQVKDRIVQGISLTKVDSAKSRLTLSFSKDSQYKVFTLKNPQRLIVDVYRIAIIKRTVEQGQGLSYTYWQDDMEGQPIRMHILQLQPGSGYYLKPFSAAVNRNGRGALSDAVGALGAKAAINACYFDTSGWVVGNCKWDGQWYGVDSTPRSALLLDEKGQASIKKDVAYTGTAVLPNGTILTILGMNRERISGDLVLYNSNFGSSTGTNEFGREVKLVDGRVTAVATAGNMSLAPGELVLSGHGANADALAAVRVGDKVLLQQTLGSADVDGATGVVGAGPSLLDEGQINVRSAAENIAGDIAYGRAPRTGIGVKKDGTILILVADGRSNVSVGMTLTELARYFRKLGAVQALNFDGGGSSEMVLNGQVLNNPSDGDERAVSIGLGVFAK